MPLPNHRVVKLRGNFSRTDCQTKTMNQEENFINQETERKLSG